MIPEHPPLPPPCPGDVLVMVTASTMSRVLVRRVTPLWIHTSNGRFGLLSGISEDRRAQLFVETPRHTEVLARADALDALDEAMIDVRRAFGAESLGGSTADIEAATAALRAILPEDP